MESYVELPIDVLREAVNLVVDELERTHGDRLRVDKDYFGAIPAEQRLNVYEQPTSLTVGQLSELMDGIQKLVQDPTRVTVRDAVRVAELLRSAGDALPT